MNLNNLPAEEALHDQKNQFIYKLNKMKTAVNRSQTLTDNDWYGGYDVGYRKALEDALNELR
ncbi:hypothetical protein [Weissella paramesenteroides]|uniref:Uncharacterized protein n=1 Tax=Weissella paramesenteroides ATCC 33313 TaxID=585506 RepID=C5R8A1_WEIPA|nr:hypothetical protein [Weissella paramesenteroides]EER75685.1 hypothetical protein HMPREF0877_0196 [Weissella paramesenteroides ATCC 33313]